MRKFIYWFSLIALFITYSCNEGEEIVEENDGWIYADQEELQVIKTPDLDESVKLVLQVRKSGNHATDSHFELKVDEEEVTKFNETQNSAYEVLPASCFQIEAASYEFPVDSQRITVKIEYLPKKIAELGGYRQDTYLLPLKLVTEDIQVKEKREYFYFTFVVDSLIFQDEFEGANQIPDPDKWSLCRRGLSDWDRYLSGSNDQAYISDGNLVLKAEKSNGQYLTGGIETINKFHFKYGKVAVRARFTSLVQGGWPAIWMMPQYPKYSGGWPNGGEIDIMEHLNKETFVHQAVHSNYTKNNNEMHENTADYVVGKYNVYELEWNSEQLTFFVNGDKVFEYDNYFFANDEEQKQWPFDAPFYLILNNSLGGEGTWPGVISDNELPAIMEVDWVRISK